MNNKISDKDKKDWENFLSNEDKLPNKDLKYKNNNSLKIKSIDLIFKGIFLSNLISLFGNFSFFERKFSQSFLSFSEILSVN